MGLLFLTSYVMFCVLLSCCLGCYFCHIVFNRFTLCVLGMVDCVWWLISSGVVLLFTMYLSLFCALAFVGFYTLLGNGFGVFLIFTPFVCLKVYLCLWFWITYLVSLWFCCHYMCVLLSWGYYFKKFHFQYVMSHCHLLYFGWMWFPLFLHIDVLCLFLSSVV